MPAAARGARRRGACRPILAVLAVVVGCSSAAGQTTAFSDTFNRSSLTVGAPATYTTTVTAGDGGATIVGSSFLQLTNDATAAADSAGRVFATAPTASYGGGYTGTLSGNAGKLIDWTVNVRYVPQGAAGGFGNGKPALAVVLGATGTDLTTASGYAIAVGHNGQSDRIQLMRFAAGLAADANLTPVVAAASPNLANVSDYASVRVRYNTATGEWFLYVRDDGAAAWGDPSAGVSTQVGTATDSTYTNLALPDFGFYWGYGPAGTQLGQFDNYTVTLSPVPVPGTVLGVGALALAAAALARRLRRRPALRISDEIVD